jgi:hypothetical protein
MILTREHLRLASACMSGYRFVVEKDLIGVDYDKVIDYCKQQNKTEIVDFLIENKHTIPVWRGSNKTMIPNQYRFFNHLTNEYEIHISKEKIDHAILVATDKRKSEKKNIFPAVFIQVTENNDGMWTSVDIEKFENEGNFKIFNQYTGLHTDMLSKKEAIAQQNEFFNNYCKDLPFIIEVNYKDEEGNVTTDWEIES